MCAGVSGAQKTGCESPEESTKLTLQSRHHKIIGKCFPIELSICPDIPWRILGRSSTGKLMSYVEMKIRRVNVS